MSANEWPEAVVVDVRRLYITEGLSAGQTAKRLAIPGLTPSAIIGGANRRAEKDPAWRKGGRVGGTSRAVKKGVGAFVQTPWSTDKPAPTGPAPRHKPKFYPAEATARSMADLEKTECGWPVGEEPARPLDQLYCGARRPAGNRYCPDHEKVAYPQKKATAPCEC